MRFLKKGKNFKKSLNLVLSTKSRHTCKFSWKNSKNWIFPGQKTLTNKNQNKWKFSHFTKKTDHDALKCIQILQFDNFKASWILFCKIYRKIIHFDFLFIKVFWPGKIQFLEFFHENLQVCLIFVDKTKVKLFLKIFPFLKNLTKSCF